jgi:hypothetical protein
MTVGSAWHVRRRFGAFSKAPLTEETEHLIHVRKGVSLAGRQAGLTLSGLLIICVVSGGSLERSPEVILVSFVGFTAAG